MEVILEQSKLTWKEIDKVVLVGGSTRMPMVKEMVAKISGKEPDFSVNPDEVVSLGAAMQGNLIKPVSVLPEKKMYLLKEVEDINSHSLGIAALRNDETGVKKEVNSIIIPKGSKCVSTKYTKEYKTSYDNQEIIDIKVTEGEEENIKFVKILHCYRFKGIPQRLSGKSRILITFFHDASGIVQVEAKDIQNNKQLIKTETTQKELERELKLAELAQARKTMVLRITLLIDISGSMYGIELAEAKKAAIDFVNNTFEKGQHVKTIKLDLQGIDSNSPMGQYYFKQIKKETGLNDSDLLQLQKPQSDIKIALISFGTKAYLNCDFTQVQQQLIDNIIPLEVNGTTNMTEALSKAYNLLKSEDSPNKLVVLVTDGMPDNENTAASMATKIKHAGFKIKTIGIGTGVTINLLKTMASSDADIYQVDSSAELGSAFGNIVEEITSEYY